MTDKSSKQLPKQKQSGQQKKSSRRSYLNEFQKDAAGTYQYSGAWIHYDTDEAGRSYAGWRTAILTCTVVMVVCIIAAGCIPAPGMQNGAYLLIPYMISVVAGALTVYAAGRLLIHGEKLREYVYDATAIKLPARAMVTAIASFLVGLMECVWIAQHGFAGAPVWFICLLLLELLSGGSALLLRNVILGTKWERCGGKR